MTSVKTKTSNRLGGSNRTKTSQRGSAAKTKKGRAARLDERATRISTAEPARSPRKSSKQQVCLDLLSRAEGATVAELRKVTGWQAHSVRGLLAGAVKSKLGMALVSEKAEGQPRRYRIPQATA